MYTRDRLTHKRGKENNIEVSLVNNNYTIILNILHSRYLIIILLIIWLMVIICGIELSIKLIYIKIMSELTT